MIMPQKDGLKIKIVYSHESILQLVESKSALQIEFCSKKTITFGQLSHYLISGNQRVHLRPTMKILIAEDNIMNQMLMIRYMGRLGWDYVIVDNGLKATEACRNDDFNAILMDIDMPIRDGIEATRYIREFNSKIPIVAITAYADDQMRTKCAEAGMNAFLAKPCSRDEILVTINECVEISTFSTE